MRKYLGISLVFIALLVGTIGCTAPTLPSAERDLQVASRHLGSVTYELAYLAKFNAMMNARQIIKTSDDPGVRETALITALDAYSDIEYYLVQAERAQGLLRSGREWVRAQRGFLSNLVEDAKEAKKRADE